MKPLRVLLALLAISCGLAQSASPDTSTPRKTVESFWKAWLAHDGRTVLALIQGSSPGPESQAAASRLSESAVQVRADGFEVIESGDDAAVIYQLHYKQGSDDFSIEDMVRLRKSGDGWRIVPAKGQGATRQGLSMLASLLSSPMFMEEAMPSNEELCLKNIKELGIATILYAGEYKHSLKRVKASQSSIREAIAPYIKNESIWRCPYDRANPSYSFNVKLAGRDFVDLNDPSATVLFYEGEKGQLSFRHNGKAAVCFADGHSRLITKDLAAKLHWTVP